MGPTVKINEGMCWWCRERPADSREHKFKRSDLVREHGRGELRGERTLVVFGEQQREARSTKNDALKFAPSLCTKCNNERSQPFDNAYDRFIEELFEREEDVLAARSFDLRVAFGSEWSSMSDNVLRYFVKHICCRIAESLTVDGERVVPVDALAFLDGGPAPAHLACEMWIEPTWLRFYEVGAGDPLWIRPMGMEAVHPGPNGRLGSRWTYGWLVFGWEFWGEDEGSHPFDNPGIDLPIVAARSVNLEFGLVPTTANRDLEELDQGWLNKVTGGEPVAPDGALARSPVGQKFLGGALDFEAGLRERAPNRRELLVEDPVPAPEIEVMRVGLLCAIAREVWAKCSLDLQDIQSVELSERLIEPAALQNAVAEMPKFSPEEGWPTVCNNFAAMASLKMIEAHGHGVDTEEGDEALLLAASLAGACGAAAGAATGNWPAAWDAINAAAAMIARLEREVQGTLPE